MISKNTIDKVFEQSRVEEVIQDFIQLRKAGSNYKALSPFSNEKTPSFVVSPVKQIWKDFSSGKGGNAISFLMEHEHFTYPEAIRYLAKKYNIEIEETTSSSEDKIKASERESLYIVSEFAKNYFVDKLKTEEGMTIAFSYFRERGFKEETVDKFQLGYSPNIVNALSIDALDKGFEVEFLEKSGLTIVNDSKYIDRFRGRVIFPIHSMSGRVLGFGARILGDKIKTAKYLNSPESLIYNKSKVLYGIFFAKQHIAKLDNCYIVEGYTDVIQLFQKGIKNVVSSSGTSLTIDQITVIRRLTTNITMLYDSDKAGVDATLRGVDMILNAGMNVSICTFPDGLDPDSFSQDRTFEEINNFFQKNTIDFIQFKASFLANSSKENPILKAKTINEIVTSVSLIPDVIKQELYIKHCSKIMDISEEVLFNTLAQLSKQRSFSPSKKIKPTIKKTEKKHDVNIIFELEKKILEILMLYGAESETFEEVIMKKSPDGEIVMEPTIVKSKVFEKIFLDLQQDEVKFTNTSFQNLYEKIIKEYQKKNEFKSELFLNSLDPELSEYATSILMGEEKYQLHDWTGKNIFVKNKQHSISQLVSETILSLRTFLIDRKVKELQENIKVNSDQNNAVLEEIGEYYKLKSLLAKKLNRVLS